MPRQPRVQFEGALYHVTARGNARQPIFLDDRDREHFLLRLREAIETHRVRLYLYCLMPNHLHLVLETPRGNLSRFMQGVLTSHGAYFNLRHERVGHLFQGRFHSKLVSRDLYLLRLTRYVHLNPAFTVSTVGLPLERRVDLMRRYRWSSYPGYIDRARRVPFVDYEPVLDLVAAGRRRPEQVYRLFVEAGLAKTDEELHELLRSSTGAIGAGASQEPSQSKSRADGFGRQEESAEPGRVLSVVAKAFGQSVPHLRRRQRGSPARAVAALMLCRHAGQTQRRAAELLGLGSNAAVSIQQRTLRERLAKDRDLREKIAAMERRIGAKT